MPAIKNHASDANSPCWPPFNYRNTEFRLRCTGSLGGWRITGGRPPNATWPTRIPTVFHTWILVLWGDGSKRYVLKMLLESKGWKQLRNTKTNKVVPDTKVIKVYVQVSQKLNCLRTLFPRYVWDVLKFYVYRKLVVPQPLRVPTRNYPAPFGKKLVKIFDDLIQNKLGMPQIPAQLPPAEEIFSHMKFDDVWQDARMVSVCHWLRGGKDLQIPSSFRSLLPSKLWSSFERNPGNLRAYIIQHMWYFWIPRYYVGICWKHFGPQTGYNRPISKSDNFYP